MATDRRVKYTKMVLKDSLIELLLEKPISRLTVKELCARADINRATFYSHYAHQYDLLEQIEAAFIQDINSYLDNTITAANETSMALVLTKIFQYIAQNRDLCKVLLSVNSNLDFQTNIMSAAGLKVMLEWQKMGLQQDIAEYIFTFVATGSIGVIHKWLQEESEKTPRQMAAFVTRLIHKGLEAFIQ